MTIKIDKVDKKFFDKIEAKRKVESDFIFRLKSEGIEYNRDLGLHRRLLNDLFSNVINIERALQIIADKTQGRVNNSHRP